MNEQIQGLGYAGPLAIGKAWLEDSSLERWFPFTADELARLKSERDELREVLASVVNYPKARWPSREVLEKARAVLERTE